VECVEPDADIPWNVLHPAEAATLRSHDASARARAFARLWSLKEAYLKALGTGLLREPSSFVVRFVEEARATIDDPSASRGVVAAETVWRSAGGMTAAISAVLLAPGA
jgi:4'-phosphopantetheinyl transferase